VDVYALLCGTATQVDRLSAGCALAGGLQQHTRRGRRGVRRLVSSGERVVEVRRMFEERSQ
jgi:hypothetical protein